MNEEFQRLGAVRGALVVVVAAIAAVAGLWSSGLSVATARREVATVRPEVPTPIATMASAPNPRRAGAKRRHRAPATAPRRKHCRPVAGVDFMVRVGQRCPKPLKHAGSAPHVSAKLRRTASRPRQIVVTPGKSQTPVTATTKQPVVANKPKAAATTQTPTGKPAQTGQPTPTGKPTPTPNGRPTPTGKLTPAPTGRPTPTGKPTSS
jgi:hypothetical protein